MKEHFTINDIALMTGLTDRTLRNYIHSGILSGEKADGAWRFSPEQIDEFMTNPIVLRALHANQNAIVYDFMQDHFKSSPQVCMVLDVPADRIKDISRRFLSMVPKEKPEAEFRLSCHSFQHQQRIILRGPADLVSNILSVCLNG